MSTEGIVYCLENPKMPGLVRIGILQRSIDTVNIIDNEFTPLPSELIYAIAVTNPVDVELKLHGKMLEEKDWDILLLRYQLCIYGF